MPASISNLIDTAYEAFTGNTELLDAVLSDDWDDIPLQPGQEPGRAGARFLIELLNKVFSDIRYVVEEIVDARGADGNGIVGVRARLHGVHTGEFLGIAPTGRETEVRTHEFHEIVDGRIVRTHHMEDWLSWFGQVGSWPSNGDRQASFMPAEETPVSVQMVQLLAGFQVSQALYVVAKLGVATALADGPRTVAQLAAETGADPDVLRRIVRDLAPLGIFRTGDGVVEVTALGATLAAGHPGSLRDVALYWMETHYAPFSELLHTATTGESAATTYRGKPFFDWITGSPELVELQNAAMATFTRGLRAAMFDRYTLPEGTLVADIGGADGSMICEFLAREPDRRGIVFDLPQVVPAAQKVLADHGLAGRVDVAAGDFFTSVPEADVYVMSAILHDWDDESCLRILRAVKDSAAPGARLVIVESVIPPDDTPHPGKLIDLTMLAMTTGRERSAAEFEALLSAAGFSMDRIVSTSTPFSFIESTVR